MKNLLLLCLAVLLFTYCSQPVNEQIVFSSYKSIDSTITFRGLFGVDKNTAYVSGNRGSFYKTVNGGDSWMKIEIPGTGNADFRDIHVSSDGTIFVMSVGMSSASKIYRSSDNGDTWQVVFTNPHEQGFLNSIAFWNDDNGICVGDPVNGYPYVITTKDGGSTWHETDTTNIPKALPGEAEFAASGMCVSVIEGGYAWFGTGGPAARVFKTTDSGASWSVNSTPVISGKNTTGIYAVYFSDKLNGFILGGDYTNEPGTEKTIAYTTNGGSDWQLIESKGVCFQSAIASFDNDGENLFISAGPAGTYFSTNAIQFIKLNNAGFHTLNRCASDNVIWAAGSKGRTAKIEF